MIQKDNYRLLKAAVHIQCALSEIDEISVSNKFTKNMTKHLAKFDKYATKERELISKLYAIDTEMMHNLEDAISEVTKKLIEKPIEGFVEITE